MDTVPPPRLRVLVVDDNRDVADVLGCLLECWGYEPAVAYDGPSALAAAAAGAPPAAALLDLGLPGIDGFELARRLRSQPGLDQCLLVALTGHGGEDVVRRCYEAGIDLHVMKACVSEDLHKILDGRLSGRLPPGQGGAAP
jgi:CheY-like chemotaxis protein